MEVALVLAGLLAATALAHFLGSRLSLQGADLPRVITRSPDPPTARGADVLDPSPPRVSVDPPSEQAHERRTVVSTAYCHTGRMASGKQTYDGAVAMNGVRFGTKYRILRGPLEGKVVTVEDRHRPGSTEFDFWMRRCDAAIRYGRRVIQIEAM